MAQQFTKQEIMEMFELSSEEFELLKEDSVNIHKRFRKIAAKYHPDQNPDDPTATAKFQKIQAMEEAFISGNYVDKSIYHSFERQQKTNTSYKTEYYQQEEFQHYTYTAPYEESWETRYYQSEPKPKRSIWWHLSFPIRLIIYLVLLGIGYSIYALASLCTVGAGIAYCVAGLRLLYNIVTQNWMAKEIILEIAIIVIVFLICFLYEKLGNLLEDAKDWIEIRLF